MAKTLRESAEPVTIVSTGPQTNVALLLNSHPELHSKIARNVIKGGAMGLCNWTPAAEFNIFVVPEAAEIVFETGTPVVMAGLDVTLKGQLHVEDSERFRAIFNIYVDPEAAEIVFQSGIPVVMAGLDVTHKAQIHVEDTERFRAIGNPVSTIVAELLDFYLEYHKDEKWGFVGAPLHDPCTIAWLLKPELFTTVERWVGVETQGKYTQGMTVVDYYYLTGNKPNASVMVDVDRQGFVDLLADRLKFYA